MLIKRVILAVLLAACCACTFHHDVRWKNGLACRCSTGLLTMDCFCVPYQPAKLPTPAVKKEPAKEPEKDDPRLFHVSR